MLREKSRYKKKAKSDEEVKEDVSDTVSEQMAVLSTPDTEDASSNVDTPSVSVETTPDESGSG